MDRFERVRDCWEQFEVVRLEAEAIGWDPAPLEGLEVHLRELVVDLQAVNDQESEGLTVDDFYRRCRATLFDKGKPDKPDEFFAGVLASVEEIRKLVRPHLER